MDRASETYGTSPSIPESTQWESQKERREKRDREYLKKEQPKLLNLMKNISLLIHTGKNDYYIRLMIWLLKSCDTFLDLLYSFSFMFDNWSVLSS